MQSSWRPISSSRRESRIPVLSLLTNLLSPKRYWCAACQMECFDVKTARLPVKHKVGLCVRCKCWKPVQVTAA